MWKAYEQSLGDTATKRGRYPMKRVIAPILAFFIFGILLTVSVFADFSSLSSAYSRASGIASSFRLKGMTVNQSASSPSFGSRPSQPKPPSPTDLSITKEVKKRERRIRKLRSKREAWRVALENLSRGRNWQKELDYWVEESQAAQVGAVMSSVGLLIGVAGPMSDAIDVHRQNSVTLWNAAQNSRSRLEEINAVLRRAELAGSQSAKLRRAAESLRFICNDLTKAMKSEMELARTFRRLVEISDNLMNAVRAVELGRGLKEKHDLLLAIKLIGDFFVDIAKDAGLAKVQKKLLEKGMTSAAQSTRLADFTIDYGYHSLRFYLAWDGVHDILGYIENERVISASMGRNIVEMTDQIKSLNTDIGRLEESRGNKESAAKVLRELWQKEQREAYIAGEWFSSRSGVRAPGEPIFQE